MKLSNRLAVSAKSKNGNITIRWRVCIHEAGHAVAGRQLLKCTVRTVVFDDGIGAADIGIDTTALRTFEEALAVAAGPAAEFLAEKCAPPQVPPSAPLETLYPERALPLKAQLQKAPSDAVAIARWCIRGIEKEPDRWANRFHWIHREARIFVARHHQEIVEVATDLFTERILTLPASGLRHG
jgi:hypothetical protein